MSTNIAVITVTYNPEIEILERQLGALTSAHIVVFVDNGSDESIRQRLVELEIRYKFLLVHCLDKNFGIAHAQNIGSEIAFSTAEKFEFLLFLDHDSVPQPNCLESMVVAAEKAALNGEQVGVVGPSLIDPRNHTEYGFHKFRFLTISRVRQQDWKDDIIECDQINSSGSLIPLHAWEKVGPFNERLFIDHVETDWCFRARHKGFKLYGTYLAEMHHEMGETNVGFWFFGRKTMPYRSPLRHYYIVRNSIFLQKQSYTPTRWKILNVIKILFTFAYFSTFDAQNTEHRKMILNGVRDGLRGKLGLFPRYQ